MGNAAVVGVVHAGRISGLAAEFAENRRKFLVLKTSAFFREFRGLYKSLAPLAFLPGLAAELAENHRKFLVLKLPRSSAAKKSLAALAPLA